MGNIFYYKTMIGKIAIVEQNGQITNLCFNPDELNNEHEIKETKVLKQAFKQLEEYFNGGRKTFSLPLAPSGTEFMKKVWNALVEIPYGETKSYKDIAQKIGNNFAYRAVGLANNKNPIPIFIPCHRVIGSNKKLVGYAGGLKIKKLLLDNEK